MTCPGITVLSGSLLAVCRNSHLATSKVSAAAFWGRYYVGHVQTQLQQQTGRSVGGLAQNYGRYATYHDNRALPGPDSTQCCGKYFRPENSSNYFHVSGTDSRGQFIYPTAWKTADGRTSHGALPNIRIESEQEAVDLLQLRAVHKNADGTTSYRRPGFTNYYVVQQESDGTFSVFYQGGKHLGSNIPLPPQTFHHGYWDQTDSTLNARTNGNRLNPMPAKPAPRRAPLPPSAHIADAGNNLVFPSRPPQPPQADADNRQQKPPPAVAEKPRAADQAPIQQSNQQSNQSPAAADPAETRLSQDERRNDAFIKAAVFAREAQLRAGALTHELERINQNPQIDEMTRSQQINGLVRSFPVANIGEAPLRYLDEKSGSQTVSDRDRTVWADLAQNLSIARNQAVAEIARLRFSEDRPPEQRVNSMARVLAALSQQSAQQIGATYRNLYADSAEAANDRSAFAAGLRESFKDYPGTDATAADLEFVVRALENTDIAQSAE